MPVKLPPSALRARFSLALCAATLLAISAEARAQTSGPNVLAVTAHPDDHAAFAATIYKITHDLRGSVDLVVITGGEGGYKYSTLAESYYGLELTDPVIGRRHMAGIRKKEAIAGGQIVGIRNYFFFGEPDRDYTLNADSVLKFVWDVTSVKRRLREILLKRRYDYVIGLLPTEGTHGAHKSATIVALQTVHDLPPEMRPIVLGATDSTKGQPATFHFTGLSGYPWTSVASGASSFHFDRTQKFGFRDALDYKIVVNWLIAEHKSQGTMQLLMNAGDVENFWYFDVNDPAGIVRTQSFFAGLAVLSFKKRTY